LTLYKEPLLYPLGVSAITVEFASEISDEANGLVHALADELDRANFNGFVECVPTYRSLTVFYAFDEVSYAEVYEQIFRLLPRVGVPWARGNKGAEQARMIRIPVIYGGEDGPDLTEVGVRNNLSADEVVGLHTAQPYRVYMLGFAPGFPFLGPIPLSIATPRRVEPRRRVKPGSVGIAGNQTGIYSMETPGGWQLIGRTTAKLFDPNRSNPFLIHPGDFVQFVRAKAEHSSATTACRCESRDTDTSRKEDDGFKSDTFLDVALAVEQTLHDTVFVEVLNEGLLTTIQDLGRLGYQRYGLSVSGAMDSVALRVANWLVGNADNEACIEAGLLGPTLRFSAPTRIAICGADMEARIDGQRKPMWRCLDVSGGQVLKLGAAVRGCFCYIAIAGGINVPVALGSRSTDMTAQIGGLRGERLVVSDRIPCRAISSPSSRSPMISSRTPIQPLRDAPGFHARPRFVDPGSISSYERDAPMRVLPAPQHHTFSDDIVKAFTEGSFIVRSGSDRRAYRLEGKKLPVCHSTDIVSDAIAAGSIQVLPSGELVVLMADRQTVGGYAKMAVVISADMPRLAQLRPGARVRFIFVSMEEAEFAARTMARDLTMIKAGLSQR